MGLVRFLYKARTFFSRGMAEGLRSWPHNRIKRKAKKGYNSASNNLYKFIPFYSMTFNIDFDDDNYYYENILRARGSHACLWNEVYTASLW